MLYDIKCRFGGLTPAAAVLVATVRALKHHGGVSKEHLGEENLPALKKGLPNLLHHLENLTKRYGLPVVVAINRFPQDTEAELALIREECAKLGASVALSEVWAKGSEGGVELAEAVLNAIDEKENRFAPLYGDDLSLKEKVETVACQVYGADGVDFTPAAAKELSRLEALGFGRFPVCMAKTQYSFSDDPAKLGWPKGFRITVRGAKVSAGAGFVVVLTGDIMTMPGLPKVPAAQSIDVDDSGKIIGLF